MSAQNFSSFVSTDKTVDAEGPTVPNTPTAKYSIRLDNGIVSGNPSATEEVDGHFIFYLRTADFLIRVKGDEDTYKKDWDKGGDALSCPGWGKDGILLGAKGGDGWPSRGLLAKKGRNPNNLPIQAQIDIWQRIASTIDLNAKRASGTGWLTDSSLRTIVGAIIDKDDNKGSSTIRYKDWIAASVISRADADTAIQGGKLIPLSTNLFSFFQTLITPESLDQLISLQTQSRGEWLRPLPSEAQADAFNSLAITDNTRKLLPITITELKSIKLIEDREDAAGIMGRQSANSWAAKTVWPDQLITNLAEWLHRSAYSFGPLFNGNYQTPDNIVFGTYEANGDMTRAEAAIRTALADTDVGELQTKLVHTGKESSLDPKGVRITRDIPSWVGTKKYSWLSPILKYSGRLGTNTDLRWDTDFHTFSQYLPFTLEGQLDKEVLAKYVDLYLGKTPPKKPKQGPSGTALSALNLRRIAHPHSIATVVKTSSYPTISPTTSTKHSDPFPYAIGPVPFSSRTIKSGSSPSSYPTSIGPPSFSPYQKGYRLTLKSPQEDLQTRKAQVYGQIPRNQTAWNAIFRDADSVVIDGVKILKPRQRQPPGSEKERTSLPGVPKVELPPASGFVLDGQINLFGLDITADISSWHGPPPEYVVVETDPPICQHVTVSSIYASDFIPSLKYTPFAKFGLSNATITFQNYFFEPTKPLGWSIEADIEINDENLFLRDLLVNVLNFDTLAIRVTAAMGLGHSWASLPQVTSFVLEGLVPFKPSEDGHGVPLCSGVELSTIGVRLTGIERYLPGLPPVTEMTYGVGVFGEMNVSVPGSTLPLVFDFEISEMDGDAYLHAGVSGDIWENAFGIDLDLTYLAFSATFSTASPLKSLSFGVLAYLNAGASSAVFSGSYSIAGDYTLSATIEDWGYDGVAALFSHITGGDELSIPDDFDLTIGAASITISNSSASRLSVEVDHLQFGGYSSVSAKVDIGSDGIVVEGKTEDVAFDEIGIKLVDVYLRAAFEKVGSSRSTDVTLGGAVQLTGIDSFPTISAAVYFSKTQGGLNWAVVGEFQDLGNTSSLGELFSGFKGTFFDDLALQQLAFFASSTDTPHLGDHNLNQYPIHKGVQVCAVLGKIDPFEQLLRRTAPELILSAGWSSSAGFLLDVVIPSTRISLGRGVSTEPVTLQLQTKPEVRLQISAGLLIPVPKADTPLAFHAYLSIAGPTVKIEGTMEGLWRDPFGISDNVTIGPVLALGVDINLPQFVATGTPDGFEFAGGLAIGQVQGQVAVEVSEDPMKELLSGSIENLSIQDVVRFTSDVTSLDLPIPPDFLDFKKLSLYLSTGAMIGTIYYPPGFSFDADLTVFGERITASAAITDSSFVAKRSLAALSVGPLQIHGHDGKDATMDISIGASTQYVKVDGAFSFMEISIATLLDLEILPSPTFVFEFDLAFTSLLTFHVDASAVGVSDLSNLSGIDFALHAVFEQHILDYVREQVIAELEMAKNTAEDAIEQAKAEVDKAEKEYEAGIEGAQKDLDAAYASWIELSDRIHSESQKVWDDYEKSLKEFNDSVDDERIKYNKALQDAENAVDAANADRAAKMRAAEADVTKAKKDMDDAISSCQRELDKVQADFNREFGNAQRDLDNAKANVASLQNQIDDLYDTIHDYENAPWYEFWKKAAIAGLYIAVGAVEASRAIAYAALDAAKAIVEGTRYLTAVGAIETAKGALELAKQTGNGALDLANETLQGVDVATNEVLKAAEETLRGVQNGGDAAWRAAEKALDEFIEGSKKLLEAASQAVEDLVKSAEWLAYQTAMAALDVAKHATVALDAAKAALDLAETSSEIIINLGEDIINAATQVIEINRIELGSSFKVFVGGGDVHFEAEVEGVVIGQKFKFDINLDLRSVAAFIHAIFTSILDFLGA